MLRFVRCSFFLGLAIWPRKNDGRCRMTGTELGPQITDIHEVLLALLSTPSEQAQPEQDREAVPYLIGIAMS